MNRIISAPAQEPQASEPHPRRANRLLGALGARDFAVLEPHLEPVALARGKVLFEPGDDVHTTYFPCQRTMVSGDHLHRPAAVVQRHPASTR